MQGTQPTTHDTQPIYFKVSIKSFEHSTLQSASREIENICLPLTRREYCESRPTARAGGPCLGSTLQEGLIPLSTSFTSFMREGVGSKTTSSVSLPRSQRGFTLLRSPHIDKKSREQFRLQTFHCQIQVPVPSKGRASLLLFLLRNGEFPGVELKVKATYWTPLYK
jgi:ribosomal protein S10|uniref:Ribosomal protein S10 n=1 Tax=Trebouxiophyceae sp. MX-AZ01 TaxID=1208065 RepID=J7KDJ2_9CHLO|nr:ribosomal protein S10 [Trebouxiophyceae sp. MX-AZ01]AFQ93772.1 ribosomal protein S10 [Trebouxiophyceae sp. MX-AZ01]